MPALRPFATFRLGYQVLAVDQGSAACHTGPAEPEKPLVLVRPLARYRASIETRR
jgi:hypothetical protein